MTYLLQNSFVSTSSISTFYAISFQTHFGILALEVAPIVYHITALLVVDILSFYVVLISQETFHRDLLLFYQTFYFQVSAFARCQLSCAKVMIQLSQNPKLT